MQNNFTPFFSRFKPDPALHLITGLFVVAVVFVGFNEFGRQIASPTCFSPAQISELNTSKNAIQDQLNSIDVSISENNNLTVTLQESLVRNNSEINNVTSALSLIGDYYISQKKNTLDSRYAQYLTYKNKRVKSRLDTTLEANYKKTYEDTLAQYNRDVATVNSNKARLVDLNNEKINIGTQVSDNDQKYLELNTSRERARSELDAINTSIETANNNMCPTSETSCSNGEDDDKDGSIDCGDNDCSSNPACITTIGCTNPCDSSCTNYNPGDSACNTGTGTIIEDMTSTGTVTTDIITSIGSTGVGYCTSDAECGSGQTCSASGCVDKKADQINEIKCEDQNACNNGAIGVVCDYVSCHTTNTDTTMGETNTCDLNEYDEYGWRVRIGFGISITNNGDNPCNIQASDCHKDTGYVKDWNYNNFQDPKSWKCVKNETNCKTGEKRKLEVICHSN